MPLSDTVTAVWMFVRWLFAGMAWVVERILLMTRRKDLNLNSFIRVIPDFPKRGILFRDITPFLGNPVAFREVVHRMAE
ncbi:MAG: hypothetical protein ACK53L_20090, partial [Pirellulaceae bacterium]